MQGTHTPVVKNMVNFSFIIRSFIVRLFIIRLFINLNGRVWAHVGESVSSCICMHAFKYPNAPVQLQMSHIVKEIDLHILVRQHMQPLKCRRGHQHTAPQQQHMLLPDRQAHTRQAAFELPIDH